MPALRLQAKKIYLVPASVKVFVTILVGTISVASSTNIEKQTDKQENHVVFANLH